MREDLGTLILGCGYSGSWLAQRLAFSGRPVWGTTRSDTQASVINSRGADSVILDTVDLAPIKKLRGRISAIVCCIPPTLRPDGTADDALPRLLDAVRRWDGLNAFLYVSATSVWGDREGAVVTEATPTGPDSPRGQARLQAEQAVLGSDLPAMVIRPSGIYGPGRSQLHRLATRSYRLVGEGAALTNRVHVHDLAALYEAAIDRGVPGEVYLASDERPASQREVVQHAVATCGLPEPTHLPDAEARVRMSKDVYAMVTGSKRLDSRWTLQRLGVSLRYPDYVSGLAGIWACEAPALRALAA